MNHSNIKVFTVIVSFNDPKSLLKTVEALIGKVEMIFIVDNYSSNENREYINRIKNSYSNNKIQVEFLDENYGIGKALNLGVKKALELNYEWILTLDQDSIIDSNMIYKFEEVIGNNKNIFCLAANVLDRNSKPLVFKTGQDGFNTYIKYFITSGSIINSKIFKEIGYFNEEYFIDFVDLEFSFRMNLYNLKIYRVHDAFIYHQLGEDISNVKIFKNYYTRHSPLRRYYMYRNFLYILRDYFRKFPYLLIKSFIIHLFLLVLILFYDKKPWISYSFISRGVLDFFKGINGRYNH